MSQESVTSDNKNETIRRAEIPEHLIIVSSDLLFSTTKNMTVPRNTMNGKISGSTENVRRKVNSISIEYCFDGNLLTISTCSSSKIKKKKQIKIIRKHFKN
jgi:hypothetical protein